jgi:hypothetical protein
MLKGINILAAIIILFQWSNTAYAQQKASLPEKIWAIKHPLVIKKAKQITQHCLIITDSLIKCGKLSNDLNGGNADAFKHCLWIAALSINMHPKKAYSLGLAHEKGNYRYFKKNKFTKEILPDSMSSVMDIINNQLGVEIGIKSKAKYTQPNWHDLLTEVLNYLEKGDLVILKKDTQGNFLTCNNEIIDLNNYENHWSIPKCLTKSNSSL